MGSRSVLGAVLLVIFLWFMLTGISAHQNNRRTVITISSSRSVKNLKPVESRKHSHHHNSDLNFVSKRRVPNGPDPIHNREFLITYWSLSKTDEEVSGNVASDY